MNELEQFMEELIKKKETYTELVLVKKGFILLGNVPGIDKYIKKQKLKVKM